MFSETPWLKGAVAGLAATGFMTAAMVLGNRFLPPRHRYPLPPRQITENILNRAGVSPLLNRDEETAATVTAHFAYGTAAGALYGALPGRRSGHAVLSGLGYGLAVWAASYLGWLPAMNCPAAAPREPASRNGLMVIAHLVWGTTLGWMLSKPWPQLGAEESPLDG